MNQIMASLGGRKFIVSLLVMVSSIAAPALYKQLGVSDSIVMMVLGIIGSIGVAYGAVNVWDSKVQQGKDGTDQNPS
jgi:ClpP class serine protease